MYSIPTQVCISESNEFDIKQYVNPFTKETQQTLVTQNRVRSKDHLPNQGYFEEVTNPPRVGWRVAGMTGNSLVLKAPFTLTNNQAVYVLVDQCVIQLMPPNTDLSEIEWQFIQTSDNSIMLLPLTVLKRPSMAKFLIRDNSIHGNNLTRADVGKVLKRQGSNPMQVLVVPEHNNAEGVLLFTNKGHMYPAGVFEDTGVLVSEQSINTAGTMMNLNGSLFGLHPESEEWTKLRSLDEELLQLMILLDKPLTITLCESSPQPVVDLSQNSDTYVRAPLTIPPSTKVTSIVNDSRMDMINGDSVRHVKVQFTRFRNGVRVSLGVRRFYSNFGTDGAYVIKTDFKSANAALDWLTELLKANPTLGVLTVKMYEQYYTYNTDIALL